MNQRRRLTLQVREQAAVEARTLNPGKQVFVQEWTDADGKPPPLWRFENPDVATFEDDAIRTP